MPVLQNLKFHRMLIFFIVCMLFSACSEQKHSSQNAGTSGAGSTPIHGTNTQARQTPVILAAGYGIGDLHLLVIGTSSPNPGKAMETERIVVEIPTSRPKEFMHYQDAQGFLFFGSTADGVNGTRFGQFGLFDGRVCFQQDGERWVARSDDDTLYQDVDGKAIAIGKVELRSYKSETGVDRSADMSKRLGKDDKWYFEADDKVYLQEPDGKITQIGWMGWRVVTPPNGDKLLMMMTKGMDKDAKWSGKHNGKLYVEK